ncbi:MAG: sigma-70 family RNA polymerase sigma factor [Lachnospiraceae bacterium]|nr:sigma-70 family RNA polymerase sigma factor [Lachnospiraceae bacterium]
MRDMDIIYNKYYKDVLFFAKSLSGDMDIAEEITQNTFCKAIESVHRFRGDCDIRIWLCKIARNDYLNYMRKERRIVLGEKTEELIANTPDTAEPVLTQIEDSESAKEIQKILEKLEEPYHEVFILRALHDMPYEKIARAYGKTESWARVTYRRARLKIVEELEKTGGKL